MSDIVLNIAGIEPGSRLAAAIHARANIFELTQKTHDAALCPAEPGGLSHALRAAHAVRIARLNGDQDFERHFAELLEQAGADTATQHVADLGFDGGGNARTKALIRHVDLVAADPKSASGSDIELLRQAGVPDADIVRLSELIAFVSYQIRVVAGLKLMRALP
jgi:uncharacterized protein YciW